MTLNQIRICSMCLVALLGFLPSAAVADEREHDRIRRAVDAGEVMPLARLLERAGLGKTGKLLDAEIEYERGRPIYEIKMLTKDNRVVKFLVDAKTGDVVEQRSKQGAGQ